MKSALALYVMIAITQWSCDISDLNEKSEREHNADGETTDESPTERPKSDKDNTPKQEKETSPTPETEKETPGTAEKGHWVLNGESALALLDAMVAEEQEDGTKVLDGLGSIGCFPFRINTSDSSGTKACGAYPHADFPEGTQGMVAPWFHLSGSAAAELYDLIPEKVGTTERTVEGRLTISCSREDQTCAIDLNR